MDQTPGRFVGSSCQVPSISKRLPRRTGTQSRSVRPTAQVVANWVKTKVESPTFRPWWLSLTDFYRRVGLELGTTLFYLAFLHLKRAVKRKSSTHVGKMGSTHASLHIRIWHARYGPATTGKTTSSCFECFVDPVHVERSLWCSIRNPPISAHLKVEKLLIPDAVSVCVCGVRE